VRRSAGNKPVISVPLVLRVGHGISSG
jgi:hypothetical protein